MHRGRELVIAGDLRLAKQETSRETAPQTLRDPMRGGAMRFTRGFWMQAAIATARNRGAAREPRFFRGFRGPLSVQG